MAAALVSGTSVFGRVSSTLTQRTYALVAQRQRQRHEVPSSAGSNPSESTQ